MSWDETSPSPGWQPGPGGSGGTGQPFQRGQPLPSSPPPGMAVPYGAAPPPRSLRELAIAARLFLGIGVLLCLSFANSLRSRADAAEAAAEAVADGSFTALWTLSSHDDSVAIGTGLYGLVLLVAGPLVIIWQHRHATNAQRLSGPLGLGPGWAIGGWFMPVGNLVLPTVQLVQAARASDPDPPEREPGLPPRGRVPSLVVAWGVAWALGGILFTAGVVMRPTEDTAVASASAGLRDFAAADRTAAAGMLVLAVAAVLAVVMVGVLTARQARAEAVRPPFAGTAGPWAGGQPGAWADQAGWAPPANPWAPPPAPGGRPGHLAPPPPPPGPHGLPPPPPPPPPPPDAWGPPR